MKVLLKKKKWIINTWSKKNLSDVTIDQVDSSGYRYKIIKRGLNDYH